MPSGSSGRLLALLYLAGAIILADQIADVTATVLLQSITTGTANWRVAVFGMAASRASALMIADVLIFSAAVGLDHRRMVRFLSVVHGVLVVALLAALGTFLLDAVEVQRQVRPGGKHAFLAATGRAAAVALFGILLAGWAAVAGWRLSRVHEHKSRSDPAAMLVSVGRDSRGGK